MYTAGEMEESLGMYILKGVFEKDIMVWRFALDMMMQVQEDEWKWFWNLRMLWKPQKLLLGK